MDKDYQNFVDRMGSFENDLDITDDDLGGDKMIVTRNRSASIKVDEEISHFGIPGMRWGRRKSINANTIGAAARTGQSAAALGQTVNKNSYNGKTLKKAKTMSDDDLKKLTSRLNLENNYMNATNQQSGKSKVESILSTAGSTLALVSSAAIMVEMVNKARGRT